MKKLIIILIALILIGSAIAAPTIIKETSKYIAFESTLDKKQTTTFILKEPMEAKELFAEANKIQEEKKK